MKKLISFIFTVSLMAALFLVGCEKEKTPAPIITGPATTCELLDKLPQDVTKPLVVNFGNRIKLTGITVNKQADDKLQVAYYWDQMDRLETYNRVFVHFTDKGNKILFQNDHPFCQQPSVEELKGKVLKETFKIDFPKNAAGQEIFVKIGLYDPKSGMRLKIESKGGIPADEGKTRAIVESLTL